MSEASGPAAGFRFLHMRFVVKQFLHHVVPGVIRPLRVLWNEMIAFVFLIFAVIPAPRTWRTWRQYEQTGEGLFNIVLAVVFMLIMGGFAWGSYRRARKAARS
ncbi:MAG: hypothetical protein HY822_24745 [Acidobacteria bacterium]|nr:hypothetical protein [Acidobacteriota bacterium]